MSDEYSFKASPVYLVPIALSLLISVICAILFVIVNPDLGYVTIMPDSGVGSFWNAVYFVALVAIGAYLMYFLLKKKIKFGIKFLIGTAISIIAFMLSFLYLGLVFVIIGFSAPLWFLAVFSAFTAFITVYLVFSGRGTMHNIIVLLIGGGLGAFLGMTVPTLSAIFILLFLGVYDVIAVYYGPVGKIASHGLENLPGVSFGFKDVHIGLGDLTFYSMLTSHAFIYFEWKACLFSFIGVLLGSFIAFKLLEKRGMFPGLPIPIILGLALMYLSNLV